MLSITLQSSHLYFQVNGQTVFSTRTIHAPPQEVGFGAFMNDAETSTFQARDAIVVSFDNLTLKELAE